MTSRSLSRILSGLLLFPLACTSGGSSGSGTGGSNGTGTGGSNSSGTGGSNSTGSGGSNATGTGGTSATGTGGSNTTGTGGKATGTGGTVVTGAGGSAGNRGSGGSAGSRASGGTTGGGGSATTGSGGSGNSSGSTDQSVLERNKNPSRDGLFVQPTLTKAAAMTMAPDTNFNTAATFTSTITNGTKVAASPLYLDGSNGAGLFFIPTAGGDVVARKEDGSSAWTASIGAPATGGIGCPTIATNPPLGILSTPVIDATSKTIYVAGIVGTAQGVTNQIASAIDITTGKVKSGWPVKVDTAASFDPKFHNQRSALSLVNGILYIPYAGYVGDCPPYQGRIVSIDTSNPTTVGQWVSQDTNGDGIWASGGLASDGSSLFASTGNIAPPPKVAPTTGHLDSEELVRLTGMGTKADSFYPSQWGSYDNQDGDLGSTNPILITVPGASPSKLVVAIGKGGDGYLVDAAQLGNGKDAGGQKATFALASGGMSVYGAPASYKTAMGAYVVMSSKGAAGCPGGGSGSQVVAVRISASPLAAAVVWCAPISGSTNPIATTTDGTSDAIVWYASNGKLVGVDGDTGATIYSSSNMCSGIPQWSSPIAVKGRIVVAGTGHLCAWGPPGALSQASLKPNTNRHKRTVASISREHG